MGGVVDLVDGSDSSSTASLGGGQWHDDGTKSNWCRYLRVHPGRDERALRPQDASRASGSATKSWVAEPEQLEMLCKRGPGCTSGSSAAPAPRMMGR